MYLCCSEVEFWGMLQWSQEASEKSFWNQVCNDQGHKHCKPRHWEGVQYVQSCSRTKRLQDFCHSSEEKFRNVFHSFFCLRFVRYFVIWKTCPRWQGEILIGFLSGLYFAERTSHELGEKEANYLLSSSFRIGEDWSRSVLQVLWRRGQHQLQHKLIFYL